MRSFLRSVSIVLLTVSSTEATSRLQARDDASCNAVVQQFYNHMWNVCALPTAFPTTSAGLYAFLNGFVPALCASDDCTSALEPYRAQITANCDANYVANITNPMSGLTPTLAVNINTTLASNGTSLKDSYLCSRDPSNSVYCYLRFTIDYVTTLSLTSGSTAAKQAQLCNSCTWTVLNHAKTYNASSALTASLPTNPGSFYSSYVTPVQNTCGSDWLSNVTVGQQPYSSPGYNSGSGRSVGSWSLMSVVAVIITVLAVSF
ncbi:hypothetical protein HDV00_003306 [Rhizophlyctis rosea]|nr:hypothetical protein HDV00_003306 [Rhizophlyctis rosea]